MMFWNKALSNLEIEYIVKSTSTPDPIDWNKPFSIGICFTPVGRLPEPKPLPDYKLPSLEEW